MVATDLHLLAAPFRLIASFIKVTLFMSSVPLICGVALLSYALGGKFDPFYTFVAYAHAHPASMLMAPLYALAAFLLLFVHMALIIGHDIGGMLAFLFAVPFVGTLMAALIAAWWFTVVRGFCAVKDGEKLSFGHGFLFVAIGFVIAFIVGLYVSEITALVTPDTEGGAAVIFSLGAFTVASPSLFYLFYHAFKTRSETIA